MSARLHQGGTLKIPCIRSTGVRDKSVSVPTKHSAAGTNRGGTTLHRGGGKGEGKGCCRCSAAAFSRNVKRWVTQLWSNAVGVVNRCAKARVNYSQVIPRRNETAELIPHDLCAAVIKVEFALARLIDSPIVRLQFQFETNERVCRAINYLRLLVSRIGIVVKTSPSVRLRENYMHKFYSVPKRGRNVSFRSLTIDSSRFRRPFKMISRRIDASFLFFFSLPRIDFHTR